MTRTANEPDEFDPAPPSHYSLANPEIAIRMAASRRASPPSLEAVFAPAVGELLGPEGVPCCHHQWRSDEDAEARLTLHGAVSTILI